MSTDTNTSTRVVEFEHLLHHVAALAKRAGVDRGKIMATVYAAITTPKES